MKQLTDFLDKELSVIKYYFKEYVLDNVDKLTAFQGYQIGILAEEFHYYVRLLKSRNLGEAKQVDLEFIESYEKTLSDFPELIPFVIQCYEKELEKLKETDVEKFMLYQMNIQPGSWVKTL